MSQATTYDTDERSWWNKLWGQVTGKEQEMDYAVPSDSLFSGAWSAAPSTLADIPEVLKAQIREEAVLTTFNRLGSSLRLLLHATTPGKEPPTPADCHQIFSVWRFELEHKVKLLPDTYCGAVMRYTPRMEASYTIDGRCGPGDVLRVRVPCWRMADRVVVRGEAEVIEASEAATLEIEDSPLAAEGVPTPEQTEADMEELRGSSAIPPSPDPDAG